MADVKGRGTAIAIAACALLGILIYVLSTPGDDAPSDASTEAHARAATARPGIATERAAAEIEPPRASAKRVDAARAAELRKSLRAVLEAAAKAHRRAEEARAERPAGESPPADPPPFGQLDKEYIRAAVQDIKPLVKECYELALHEQKDLAGRLVVRFEILADEEIGGVVDQSAIDEEKSDLRHPILDECVRETMYGLELPAPKGGGKVNVTYPFIFSNTGEAEPTP